MTNIPKTIYLQIGEDCPTDDGEDFNKLYGVSWCAERINENDIEYELKGNEEKARIKGVLLGLQICKEMWAQGTISHENIYENEVYYKEELEKIKSQLK
jgi:hypothetical protein